MALGIAENHGNDAHEGHGGSIVVAVVINDQWRSQDFNIGGQSTKYITR